MTASSAEPAPLVERNGWSFNFDVDACRAATLGQLVELIHGQCDGDLDDGQRAFGMLIKELWHRTPKSIARDICKRPLVGTEDNLVKLICTFSVDARGVVLNEIDNTIEFESRVREKAWAESLIDETARTYRYHPAVALNVALKHSMFSHITFEQTAQLLFRSKADKCLSSPWEDLTDVVAALAEKFGLQCKTCKAVKRPQYNGVIRSIYLGVSSYGFYSNDDSCFSDNHSWRLGICEQCWARQQLARTVPQHDVQRAFNIARAAGIPMNNITRTEDGRFKITIKKSKPKKRARGYGKKVWQWKAAFNALQELGIDIEELSRDLH